MSALHKILPQTLTINELGAWIAENAIETKQHEEHYKLTEKEIAAFEHDSSIASRELDKLKALLDDFKEKLKDGTTTEITVQIPVNKGLEVLKANREYADRQLTLGYRVELTTLYALPYPEKKQIVFFDVKGKEWGNYNYTMNPLQEQKYDKPILTAAENFKKNLAKDGMKVTGYDKDTNTLSIETGGEKSFIPDQEGPLFDSD